MLEKSASLWLAHSIAVDNHFNEDRIILGVFPCFHVFVPHKFGAAKTRVLFHLWSTQERLILRAGIGFDDELDVFAFLRILTLVK